MILRKHLLAAIGLSAVLVAGIAMARPNNGDMGVYLDANGRVVGTWAPAATALSAGPAPAPAAW